MTSIASPVPRDTRWYHPIAWFWGAVFLTNTIPHFVAGVSGSAFQSPFATPPGEGLSSAMLNVAWGFANLVVGYLLLLRVGRFEVRRSAHVIAPLLAVFGMGMFLARHFARFHGGE
jgi:hypothetical protein